MAEMDAVVPALEADGDAVTAALVVPNHVGEEFLDHEVDAEGGFVVDLVDPDEGIQKREDLLEGADLAPELPIDRGHSSNPPLIDDLTAPVTRERRLPIW